MGQQHSPNERVPPAPDLPQPHNPQEDTEADLRLPRLYPMHHRLSLRF
jgi:hypothetical protein